MDACQANPQRERAYHDLANGELALAIDALKSAIRFSPSPQNHVGLLPRLEDIAQEVLTA